MNEHFENSNNSSIASGGMTEPLRSHLHSREELCRQLESLPQNADADYAEQLAALQTKWNTLPEVPPEYAEILDKHFALALKAAQTAAVEIEARCQQHQAKIAEAKALHKKLDKLLAAGELILHSEVETLNRQWVECTETLSSLESDAETFMAKFRPLSERMQAEQAAENARAAAADKLTEELADLTAKDDIDLLKERKVAIESEYTAIGNVPKASADRYKDAHRQAVSKLSQHYETLDLARWESFTLKQDICNELDRLLDLPENELPKAAKELQALRDKWKLLGTVPKSKADEINPRYIEATRKLQHRIDEYYADLRQKHKQAALAKQQLCDKAAALAESTDWNDGAAAFKELQAEWKAIPGAGVHEKELFTAFRTSADKFFNARTAYFNERNAKFEAVAEIKQKLISQAEQLLEPTQKTSDSAQRAKQLRSEYTLAGRAGRAESELNAKFDAALDKFFAGRREEFANREEQAKKLINEIETLSVDITDPSSALSRYRAIKNELKELGCRNTFQSEIKAGEKFDTALSQAKARLFADKLGMSKLVTRQLSAVWESVKSGTELEENCLAIENLDKFPKLAAVATLIAQVASGDAKAEEKLLKSLASATSERKRIVAELEKTVGIENKSENESSMSDAMSLAAELTAAIVGNFASANAKAETPRSTADPKQLLSEFVNAGLPEADSLEELFTRFDNAYAKLG
ncbi:MAG: DUF349 domain-containing protein [Victivallales bacterium]|jgi:hypothetical protein|nr:DUF349 domain-containing protein [Victivallales bacterium]